MRIIYHNYIRCLYKVIRLNFLCQLSSALLFLNKIQINSIMKTLLLLDDVMKYVSIERANENLITVKTQ